MSDIHITGTLLRAAQAYVQPDGTAWLQTELQQTGSPVTVRASRRLGNGAAAQLAATSAAHHLLAGTRVTVHAERVAIVRGRVPHLVLLDVQRIEYPLPSARHEPAEKEHA